MKPEGWLESVNCAIEGILWAVRTQRHLRFHFWAALGLLAAALFLRVSAVEFILLALAAVLVILAELLNTALETVVDLVSPEYHPLAKKAKDVAAGGVLVAGIGAVFVGYLGLSPYVFPVPGGNGGVGGPAPGEAAVVSVLVVCLLVGLLKARQSGDGPLHGGMPSGHAAIAFSIATSICLSGVPHALGLLALVMAALVSQSRLLMRIHSLAEVLCGGAVGALATLALYFLLGLFR